MYESLRSHCLQNYSDFEIIFGIADPDDPAVHVVDRLRREFPGVAMRLAVCREILGTNLKVSNLVQMLPHARHPYLVISDSDIRVQPDYLRQVIWPLRDPGVGLLTCLYRGAFGGTLGSCLEAVGIETAFCGGVLAAREVEKGIRFGLGSTLAVSDRKSTRLNSSHSRASRMPSSA